MRSGLRALLRLLRVWHELRIDTLYVLTRFDKLTHTRLLHLD